MLFIFLANYGKYMSTR